MSPSLYCITQKLILPIDEYSKKLAMEISQQAYERQSKLLKDAFVDDGVKT